LRGLRWKGAVVSRRGSNTPIGPVSPDLSPGAASTHSRETPMMPDIEKGKKGSFSLEVPSVASSLDAAKARAILERMVDPHWYVDLHRAWSLSRTNDRGSVTDTVAVAYRGVAAAMAPMESLALYLVGDLPRECTATDYERQTVMMPLEILDGKPSKVTCDWSRSFFGQGVDTWTAEWPVAGSGGRPRFQKRMIVCEPLRLLQIERSVATALGEERVFHLASSDVKKLRAGSAGAEGWVCLRATKEGALQAARSPRETPPSDDGWVTLTSSAPAPRELRAAFDPQLLRLVLTGAGDLTFRMPTHASSAVGFKTASGVSLCVMPVRTVWAHEAIDD
jgi:hypothetical protein